MYAQYIEFIGNHTMLFVAFFMILVFLMWNMFSANIQGYGRVIPSEAIQLINHDEAIVLDVRENNEYRDGHIINSIHIPLKKISNSINTLDKYKDKNIIVSCLSGNRSSHACSILKKNGFEKLHNLQGGIHAWKNDNLPLSYKS
jgi:rhodanese-related sulfurtransferase